MALLASGALTASALTMVGTVAPAHAANPVDVHIIATNDFHGRLAAEPSNPPKAGDVAGAAVLAGYVKAQKAANPNTAFVAAGDLIGASTFDSFVDQDNPTIDALNEAGLDVSAAGNHEFDRGYADLAGRVQDRADWEYIAANVKKADNSDALAPSWTQTFGEGTPDEVKVGYVGAVTEHLSELVSPAGIAGLQIKDVVTSVNAEATKLKTAGADVVVMLVHEGAPNTDCATMDDDPNSDFGSIVTGVNADVDAIVSGHTHLKYDCKFPVAAWSNRTVKERPVVSAGQYGTYVNNLTFTVDTDATTASKVTGVATATTALNAAAAPDPATAAIVAAAKANGDVLGKAELGKINGEFNRAQRPKADGTGPEENRGGESTLGNLVAEAQRWATSTPTAGAAQIAFMNPGGLRADMRGEAGAFPRTLTYKGAANVQPFANTLVNMRMTGAQIRQVLTEQWQPAGSSRPFLRLGVSKGFTYTYDPSTKKITGMWLNGAPVAEATSYSVTVNSFLASGGDNFGTFAQGTGARDTGQVDLSGMVDFMAQYKTAALAVDSAQRAVGVQVPAGSPTIYQPGSKLALNVSSLAMTGAGDKQDTTLQVKLGSQVIGTVPVVNTVAPGATDDESGKAVVALTVPAYQGTPTGVTLVGTTTGTTVNVPLTFNKFPVDGKLKVKKPKKIKVGKKAKFKFTVVPKVEGAPIDGKIVVKVAGVKKKIKAVVKANGKAVVKLPTFKRAGTYKVKIRFKGSDTITDIKKTVKVKVVRR